MIQVKQTGSWTPEEVFLFFERHGLLTLGMQENPQRVIDLSMASTFWIWYDNETPVALMLELPDIEPGVKTLMLVPEDRTMGKRLYNDLVDIAPVLQNLWFNEMGLRRVQSVVPVSRVNMQRVLRALGFQEETRRGVGIRGMYALNGQEAQAAIIYGLIPGDKAPKHKEEEVHAAVD